MSDYRNLPPRKASESIANLSDQLVGFSQEVANAVEDISNQYEVSKEFALLIVQTAIEDMKLDVAHHKNYHLELISDEMHEFTCALERIEERIEEYL